jgi:hypothetical protein
MFNAQCSVPNVQGKSNKAQELLVKQKHSTSGVLLFYLTSVPVVCVPS